MVARTLDAGGLLWVWPVDEIGVKAQVTAKRELAVRMRRLAESMLDADRANLLRGAEELEREAAELERASKQAT